METNNMNLNEKNLLDKLAKLNLQSVKTSGTKSLYKGKEYSEAVAIGNEKKFRNKIRKQLNIFAINLLSAYKAGNKERAKQVFSEFKKMYAENYLLNDFSLSSIYDGNKEEKKEFFSLFLQTCILLNK